MKRVAAPLLALALLAAASAPAEARFRSCQQVNFTPNSDDLAASIRVQRVSCSYAREFIMATEGSPPRSVRGWSCTRKPVEDVGLSYSSYRCTRGSRTMRWKRY